MPKVFTGRNKSLGLERGASRSHESEWSWQRKCCSEGGTNGLNAHMHKHTHTTPKLTACEFSRVWKQQRVRVSKLPWILKWRISIMNWLAMQLHRRLLLTLRACECRLMSSHVCIPMCSTACFAHLYNWFFHSLEQCVLQPRLLLFLLVWIWKCICNLSPAAKGQIHSGNSRMCILNEF